LTGKVFSGPDGIFNCGRGFPDYAWWDEFGIDITSFEERVKKMQECD